MRAIATLTTKAGKTITIATMDGLDEADRHIGCAMNFTREQLADYLCEPTTDHNWQTITLTLERGS